MNAFASRTSEKLTAVELSGRTASPCVVLSGPPETALGVAAVISDGGAVRASRRSGIGTRQEDRLVTQARGPYGGTSRAGQAQALALRCQAAKRRSDGPERAAGSASWRMKARAVRVALVHTAYELAVIARRMLSEGSGLSPRGPSVTNTKPRALERIHDQRGDLRQLRSTPSRRRLAVRRSSVAPAWPERPRREELPVPLGRPFAGPRHCRRRFVCVGIDSPLEAQLHVARQRGP